jgi:hypothetical protein
VLAGVAQVADTAAGSGPRRSAAPDLTVIAVDDFGRLRFIDVRAGDWHRLDLDLPPTVATRFAADTMIEAGGRSVMDADDAVVTVDLDTRLVRVVAEDYRVVPATSTSVSATDFDWRLFPTTLVTRG